jgi:hypothetical protein
MSAPAPSMPPVGLVRAPVALLSYLCHEEVDSMCTGNQARVHQAAQGIAMPGMLHLDDVCRPNH